MVPKALAINPLIRSLGITVMKILKAEIYSWLFMRRTYIRCMVALLPEVEILQLQEITAVVDNMVP